MFSPKLTRSIAAGAAAVAVAIGAYAIGNAPHHIFVSKGFKVTGTS
jgi:hypothetical protein